MKVLLVFAAYYKDKYISEKKRIFWEPLGISYLAAYLRRGGHDVDMFYPLMYGYSEEEVSKYLEENINNYDMLGISVPTPNINDTKGIVDIINKLKYGKPVILGGLGATCNWKNFLDLDVDGLIIGEGEKAILEIANKIEKGLPFNDVKGFAYVSSDGSKVRNGYVELIENLDDNVFPARDNALKIMEMYGKDSINIQIQTSRGCYGNCSFCSMLKYSTEQGGVRYRARSAKNVVQEIIELHDKYNIKNFDFMDENFFPSDREIAIKKAQEFAKEISAHNLDINIFLQCQLHVISKELLAALKEAKVNSIFIGLDSFNDIDLRVFRKPYNSKTVREVLEIVRESDFSFDVDSKYRIKTGFINFTPLSTVETIREAGQYFKEYGLTTKKLLRILRVDNFATPMVQTIRETFPEFGENNFFQDKRIEKFYNGLLDYSNNFNQIRTKLRYLETLFDDKNDKELSKVKKYRKLIDDLFYDFYFSGLDCVEKEMDFDSFAASKKNEFMQKEKECIEYLAKYEENNDVSYSNVAYKHSR